MCGVHTCLNLFKIKSRLSFRGEAPKQMGVRGQRPWERGPRGGSPWICDPYSRPEFKVVYDRLWTVLGNKTVMWQF